MYVGGLLWGFGLLKRFWGLEVCPREILPMKFPDLSCEQCSEHSEGSIGVRFRFGLVRLVINILDSEKAHDVSSTREWAEEKLKMLAMKKLSNNKSIDHLLLVRSSRVMVDINRFFLIVPWSVCGRVVGPSYLRFQTKNLFGLGFHHEAGTSYT